MVFRKLVSIINPLVFSLPDLLISFSSRWFGWPTSWALSMPSSFNRSRPYPALQCFQYRIQTYLLRCNFNWSPVNLRVQSCMGNEDFITSDRPKIRSCVSASARQDLITQDCASASSREEHQMCRCKRRSCNVRWSQVCVCVCVNKKKYVKRTKPNKNVDSSPPTPQFPPEIPPHDHEETETDNSAVARGAPSPKTWIYRDTSYKHLLVETPEV